MRVYHEGDFHPMGTDPGYVDIRRILPHTQDYIVHYRDGCGSGKGDLSRLPISVKRVDAVPVWLTLKSYIT
jgi:hypothetical protein